MVTKLNLIFDILIRVGTYLKYKEVVFMIGLFYTVHNYP